LENLVDVLGVELIVSNAIDEQDVLVDALAEVGGVHLGVQVVHIEGVVHLLVHGLCDLRQELREQIKHMALPRESFQIMHLTRLVVIVFVGFNFVRLMDVKILLLFRSLFVLRNDRLVFFLRSFLDGLKLLRGYVGVDFNLLEATI